MNISNVLSCFDGISCAQLALRRAGISYTNYYASEIDKFTISVTQAHFPQTIQVGNIKELKPDNFSNIDLIIGGFPCQSFSISGKKLYFEDKRGELFFDLVRLKNTIQPKYFLFENVKMRSDIRSAISTLLGCEAIEINSNLFTAQNRKRLYWTNIPIGPFVVDSRVYLKDILETNVQSSESIKLKRPLSEQLIIGENPQVLTEARTESAKTERRNNLQNGFDYCSRSDKEYVLRTDGKANTVTTSEFENILFDKQIRTLTPIECERLQGLPDNYTHFLSNKQRYKSIGNGFTVPVIAHILKGMM